MAEKITIPTNIAVHLEFLRDDCKYSVHPQYGESYSLYCNAINSVTNTRTDKGTLRATPKLYEAILATGAGKTAVVTVTKHETAGNKIEWLVNLVRPCSLPGFKVEAWEPNGPLPGSAPAQAQAPAAPANGSDPFGGAVTPPADSTRPTGFQPRPTMTLDDLYHLYRQCAIRGVAIAEHLFGQEVEASVVKDISTTFFIEANKRGITGKEVPEVAEVAEVAEPVVAFGSTGNDDIPF